MRRDIAAGVERPRVVDLPRADLLILQVVGEQRRQRRGRLPQQREPRGDRLLGIGIRLAPQVGLHHAGVAQVRLRLSTASSSRPRALCTRSRRAHIITDESVMKSITGAKTGIRAPLAATNGAAATIPVGPMTADPTPVPMVISVAGLAVAWRRADRGGQRRHHADYRGRGLRHGRLLRDGQCAGRDRRGPAGQDGSRVPTRAAVKRS